jgi:hypothetical protein
LKRTGLSIRRPHIRRRPPAQNELINQFLIDVQETFKRSDRAVISNVDETDWSLINPHQVTIAPRGAESVSANFNGDPKTGLTAIAIITAAGEKFLLWVICKGTTERCERRFRDDFARQIESGQLILCHQSSGWTDNIISKSVLQCLSDRAGDSHSTLIWDVDRAHREHGLKEYAASKGVRLLFIPPGMTDAYQPLDRRVFGSLKARERARFDERWIENPGLALTLVDEIEILLEVWTAIPQGEIFDAWSNLDPEHL